MLHLLRANTRLILWIVVVAFVGFIILVWGADLQFNTQQQGFLGAVNGQGISHQDFQRRLTARLQDLRARGQREASFEEERAAVEQTWESMISEVLVAQEARKRRLPISDGEVVYWIRSNPPEPLRQDPAFTDSTGVFDVARYHEALAQAPEQFRWLEEYVRAQIPVTKLQQDILSGAKVSNAEVEGFVRERYEQMRGALVWVNPATFPGALTDVTEAEARTYYDAHPDEFRAEERVRLVVARVPKQSSPADEAEVLEEVRGYSGSIARGEATFADLAESFSQDAFAQNGGDHGRAELRAQMEPELANRVFSLAIGQMSEPFRIGDRVVLVRVAADTVIDGQPARRIATLERRIEPGADRLSELRDQVNDIHRQSARRGLATAATAVGAQVDTTTLLERGGFSPLLMEVREAVEFAFERPAGTVASPVETARDFVLYQVIDKRPAEVRPFEEVLPNARRQVLRTRQHEVARGKADSLLASFHASGDLTRAAQTVGLTVRNTDRFNRKGGIPGVARSPELVAAAFALAPGQVSDLIDTENGFFLVRADSLIAPAPEELQSHRTTARRTLEFERQTQLFQTWLAQVRAGADIEDHRQAAF
jgi:parvulin-like peptidyl-prolyl isomerase